MSDYLTFRRFSSVQEAQIIYSLLAEHGIPCEVDTTPLLLSTTIVGQIQEKDIALKMPAENFVIADKIIRENTRIEEPEADYYLLDFTDAALKEVIEKKDEWGDYDYALALQLLEKRGVGLTEEDIKKLQQKRVTRLATPEEAQPFWVMAGYTSSFLGGLFGIMLGSVFITLKRTLPDGTRVPSFSKSTRFHGRIIIIVGVVMFFAWTFHIANGGSPMNFPGIDWLLNVGEGVYGR